MKKRYLLMFIVLMMIFVPKIIQAQMSVSVPNLIGIPIGTVVDIPVWGNNWNQVSSACITLDYNTIALTYDGYQNMDTIFGFPIIINSGGQIRFAFFGMNEITFAVDTLFHLRFIYNGGCGQLNFDTLPPNGCVYPVINNGGVNCYASSRNMSPEEFDLQVYPNPANDLVNVSFSSTVIFGNAVVQIIDSKGTVLQERITGTYDKLVQFETAKLSTGNYEICVQIPNRATLCKPLIVIR